MRTSICRAADPSEQSAKSIPSNFGFRSMHAVIGWLTKGSQMDHTQRQRHSRTISQLHANIYNWTYTFICSRLDPKVAIESCCSLLGSNNSRPLARSVVYDFWLPVSNRRRTSIAMVGFEGLWITPRAVWNRTVFLLSEQSAFVDTVGVYDGASGSRVVRWPKRAIPSFPYGRTSILPSALPYFHRRFHIYFHTSSGNCTTCCAWAKHAYSILLKRKVCTNVR